MIATCEEYNPNSGVYYRHELIAIVKHEESINAAFTSAFKTTRNICDFKRLFLRACENGRADYPFSAYICSRAMDAG